jgi:ribonucleoside-diphosphate reductase beta chain
MPDASAWRALPRSRRIRLAVLLAGSCVAESSVADELAPFAPAANDPVTAAVFAAQRADEQRHTVLFDRIAASVLGLPGSDPPGRCEAARALTPPAVLDLFERRLPQTVAAMSVGRAGLGQGIALYHMILEGVVLNAAQRALLDDLADGALPGVRAGVELVERDERWHVGFGLRCLLDLRPEPALLAPLVREGDLAAAAWGDVVPPSVQARVTFRHRRRLAAMGLVPPSGATHAAGVGSAD